MNVTWVKRKSDLNSYSVMMPLVWAVVTAAYLIGQRESAVMIADCVRGIVCAWSCVGV